VRTSVYPHIVSVSVRQDECFEVVCCVVLDRSARSVFVDGYGATLPDAIYDCLVEIRKRMDLSDREVIRLSCLATADAVARYARRMG